MFCNVPLHLQVVWCANLVFSDDINDKIAKRLEYAPNLRAVASLTKFPNGIPGFVLMQSRCICDVSWASKGHSCYIYSRLPPEPEAAEAAKAAEAAEAAENSRSCDFPFCFSIPIPV